MAAFLSDLFAGMSLDSLLVYACAIRGVMVSTSKDAGPGLIATLLSRRQQVTSSKK